MWNKNNGNHSGKHVGGSQYKPCTSPENKQRIIFRFTNISSNSRSFSSAPSVLKTFRFVYKRFVPEIQLYFLFSFLLQRIPGGTAVTFPGKLLYKHEDIRSTIPLFYNLPITCSKFCSFARNACLLIQDNSCYLRARPKHFLHFPFLYCLFVYLFARTILYLL